MAHIKQEIILKNTMSRQQFVRVSPQNGQFNQQPLQQGRQCGNRHIMQQQQQNPTNYQYIPYSVNNQPVLVRHPVQQHSFQEAHRNFINNQQVHSTNHQSCMPPASFSPVHATSPYSNGTSMSPYYEEVVQSSSGPCSIPLIEPNDRPVGIEMLSIQSQPPSPYVSGDTQFDHNYGQQQQSTTTPDFFNDAVSPNPLYHYDSTDAVPAVINNQLSPDNCIKVIAQALMRSAETFDPNPINIPNFFSGSRSSIDSLDSMPELEPITESYTLTDLIEIIERDIQETYMQQHVPILPVKTHKVKEIRTNETTLHKLLKPPSKNSKTIDFLAPPHRGAAKKTTKKFQCIVCKKQFAGASHLRSHFKTAVHKNEVLVTQMTDPVNMPETWKLEDSFCGICNKSFVDEYALHEHISTKHGDVQQALGTLQQAQPSLQATELQSQFPQGI